MTVKNSPMYWKDIGYQAAKRGDHRAPTLNFLVRQALRGIEVGDPETVRIMTSFSAGYDQYLAEITDSEIDPILA